MDNEVKKSNRSEYYKNYYAKNKDKLTEKLYKRIECESVIELLIFKT
jgi:hypothetical protein